MIHHPRHKLSVLTLFVLTALRIEGDYRQQMKDYRNEVVNFVLRARANYEGKNPSWLSYEKMRSVIEKKMFSNTEDLLPVISFNAKGSQDEPIPH
jgi:predicted Ser/Thr protein kinase